LEAGLCPDAPRELLLSRLLAGYKGVGMGMGIEEGGKEGNREEK